MIPLVLPQGMVKRALLVGMLLLASCFKGGGGATTAPPPKNTAVAKGPDFSATIADPVGFLPMDSEIVLGLDVDQVRRSPLWPQLEARVTTAGGAGLTAFKAICGFDPMTTVHGIMMGIKNLKQQTPDGVIVVRGLDRPRLMGCMTKAQQNPDHSVVIEDGIVVIAGKSDPTTVAFAFVDASTVVGVIGPTASKGQLKSVLTSGAPLRSSPAFGSLLDLTDLRASLWGVLNGASSVFDQASGMIGMRPKAVFGSVTLANGLGMKMHLRLETATQASQIQTMIGGQIGMARAMFDKLDVTTEDADLVIALAMTDAQLSSMMQLLGAQLGGP